MSRDTQMRVRRVCRRTRSSRSQCGDVVKPPREHMLPSWSHTPGESVFTEPRQIKASSGQPKPKECVGSSRHRLQEVWAGVETGM